MGQLRSHYDNLKVARDAPPEVIEAAYRSLAQKYHPERNPTPEAARVLALISHAYSVLANQKLRREHDEWIRQSEAADKSPAPAEAGTDASAKRSSWGLDKALAGVLIMVVLGLVIWRDWPLPKTSIARSTAPPTSSPGASAPTTTNDDIAAATAMAPSANAYLKDASTTWVVDGPDVPISQIVQAPSPNFSSAKSAINWHVEGPPIPIECARAQPLPESKVLASRWGAGRQNWPELRIKASPGSNIYAKVVAASDKSEVATALVRMDDEVLVRLQPGEYKLRYVPIESWHGANLVKLCAGPSGTEGDDVIALHAATSKENSIMVHTITVILQKQIGGNFPTHEIPMDEF
jgi:hypothetical protein